MVIVLSVQDEGLEEHLFAVLYAVVGFAVCCGRMSSKSTAYHLRRFWFVYTVVGESWLACSHHCTSIQTLVLFPFLYGPLFPICLSYPFALCCAEKGMNTIH